MTESAKRIRRTILQMSFDAKLGHVKGALSCVDILDHLYGGLLTPADLLIFSKGHSAAALYATWAEYGIISPETLATYGKPDSPLQSHPCKHVCPMLAMSSGSLGHGLGVVAGMAYARKLVGNAGKVHVILSDGECNEGSTWEAAMFIESQRLDNLCVWVDWNGSQSVAETYQVAGGKLDGKFWSFMPSVTVKMPNNKTGVSFIDRDPILWHYRVPSREDLDAAFRELA